MFFFHDVVQKLLHITNGFDDTGSFPPLI